MIRGLLCAINLLVLGAGVSRGDDRPNILFILADDVGREVLGCYGGTSYKTPRLDALAAEGTRFDQAYVMAVCHPTRVALLSGRYPFQLKHPRWGSYPAAAEKATMAWALKKAGYATAVAGKWQLALLKQDPAHPHRLGFDDYSLFGWHEGPRYWDPLIWQNGKIREDVSGKYGPDVYVDFLIEFMARQQRQKKRFLAFYSMALCHDVTDDLNEPVPYGPGKNHYETYAEMVVEMDRLVGRLLDALDELGLRKNTLVVFATDNGTAGASIHRHENGRLIRQSVTSRFRGAEVPGGKGKLTDWGTRVPLICRWPGRLAANQRSDQLVDATDFFPTFAQAAGATVPDDVRGFNFLAALRNPEAKRVRRWAFAEHGKRQWVRTREWKLYGNGSFHNMIEDSNETTPLDPKDLGAAGRTAHQRLTRALESLGLN